MRTAFHNLRTTMLAPVAGTAILGALAAASPPAALEDGAASSIIGAELVAGQAFHKLQILVDRFPMRLSGSAGYDAAARWAVEEFRRDGMDRVWTEKVMVPHWVRGAEAGRIVAPVDWPMAVTALGLSDPTPDGGITAEVVEVGGFEELRAAGEAVKGKIVLYNKRIYPGGGEGRGYGAAAPLRHDGAVEAAKLGAVATMIRSLGTLYARLPHTGMMSYADGVPRIPGAAISAEDAEHIHRLLAAGETVRVSLVLGCRNLPDVESTNVLAEIRGREKPEEIVLIGAHLDAWDLGQGATDDGTGCAQVLEAMRVIRSLGLRPRRTIRAVLFTNEENGLRGGKAYADAHADELARHVSAIETDSGGGRPLGFGVSAGPGGVETVRRLARSLRAIGADEITEGGGGADISPMVSAGFAMLGQRQETTRYFDYHHSAADTLDKVEPADLTKSAAALAVMAYGIADLPESLPRR